MRNCLIIFIIQCTLISSNMISFEYNIDLFPTINIVINNTLIRTLISIYLPYTLIRTNQIKNPLTNENKEIQLENNIILTEYISNISNQLFFLPNFSFYLTLNLPHHQDEGIGLGYKFENESFSFIHQLYNLR